MCVVRRLRASVFGLWIGPGPGCVGSTGFEAAQPIAKTEDESVTCALRARVGTAVSEGECRAGTHNETHGWDPLPDGVHASREGGCAAQGGACAAARPCVGRRGGVAR